MMNMSINTDTIFTHDQSDAIILPEILKIPTIRANMRRKPRV
jgi:hypothetical protein